MLENSSKKPMAIPGLWALYFGAGYMRVSGDVWRKAVLYSFTGGADGGNPFGGVVRDSSGNLYGTTYRGGTDSTGVAFRLTP